MTNQHPWDGRDHSNPNKPIYRVVSNHDSTFKPKKKKSIIQSIHVSDHFQHKGKHHHVTALIPVVLAEPQLEINLEHTVRLDEPAIEIKRIRKEVELTECQLLPSFFQEKNPIYTLYVCGFVRKNIEYATKEQQNQINHNIHGNIRHTTVKVPFEFSTQLKLNVPANLDFQKPNPIAEIEFLDEHKCNRDSKEFGNINAVHLNEKVFCELVNAAIIELDTVEEDCSSKTFQTLKERMAVQITLKILQKQEVTIPNKKNKDKKRKKKDKKKHKHHYKHKHSHKHEHHHKHKEDKDKDKKDRDRDRDRNRDRDKERDHDIEKKLDQKIDKIVDKIVDFDKDK